MLDDEDLDTPDDADLPAEGAIPVAGEGWPASAAGAEPSSPAFIPYHPSMNAQQRRMIDMMNTRKMQEYRQELQERRSAATREAVSDRQQRSFEFRERNANARRAYSEQQADRRQQERLNTEQRKSQYEADRRDATEAMKIRAEDRAAARREAHERRVEHEKRLQNDPDYRREFEFAGVDQAEAAGRDASRRRALDALPDQMPRTMALPIGMGDGPGASFNAPSTAMQMPEGAGRAADDSQGALDLRMGREFGANNPTEAALSRTRAESQIGSDYDVLDRQAQGQKLDVRAKTSPRRADFKQDFKERVAPYEEALDGLLKEGEEEAKTGKVDAAALPKLGDPKNKNQKQRFLDLVDRVAGANDVSPDTVTRALFGMTQMVNEANAPRILPNGLVDYNGVRFVMDADTFRMAAMMRAERLKEMRDAATAKKTQVDMEDENRRQALGRRRQAIDDMNRNPTAGKAMKFNMRRWAEEHGNASE